MNSIHIGKSHITETADGLALLSADVTVNNIEKQICFSVPLQYRESLCEDRADPFVVAMIRTAMEQGRDIECEDPVSEKLLYSLNHFYIPTLAPVFEQLKQMKVIAEPATPCVTRDTTGIVCSEYNNVLEKLDQISEYKPEVICVTSDKTLSNDLIDKLKEREISLLPVYSNLDQILDSDPEQTITIRRLAPVLALQGLLGTLIYIPQFSDIDFSFDPDSADHYENLSVECFSTDSLHMLFMPF